jgi:hypothetical protein|tara:strand:+ start:5174 stop:5473 length:300 start_codon:yes stop_codon:yes gene_type:complete
MAIKFFAADQTGNASASLTMSAGGNISSRVIRLVGTALDGATVSISVSETGMSYAAIVVHTFTSLSNEPKIITLSSDYEVTATIAGSSGSGDINVTLST